MPPLPDIDVAQIIDWRGDRPAVPTTGTPVPKPAAGRNLTAAHQAIRGAQAGPRLVPPATASIHEGVVFKPSPPPSPPPPATSAVARLPPPLRDLVSASIALAAVSCTEPTAAMLIPLGADLQRAAQAALDAWEAR